MRWDDLFEKSSTNKEQFMEIMLSGNTHNDFQFFNIDNPSDMNKVYDYYSKYAQTLVDFMSPKNNIYNKKTVKELDFSYSWDERLNAGSFERIKTDVIKINEGSIQKIYAFFYKLMAKGNLFSTNKEDKLLCINLISHNIGQEDIVVPMFLCGSIEKNNIAEYMARFAIEFLIGHEIGHAFNGHTKVYLDILNKLNRENVKECRERLFLDLQTLETDADAYGINRVLEQAIGLIENEDKIFTILKQKQDIFQLLCYSIHGLYYMMREEYGYEDIVDYKEKIHPPKFVRESLIYGALHEHLEYLNEWKKTDYSYNFREVNIGLIEKNISTIMGKDNRKYLQFIDDNIQIWCECSKQIEENWKRIASLIKTQARLPIEGIDYN